MSEQILTVRESVDGSRIEIVGTRHALNFLRDLIGELDDGCNVISAMTVDGGSEIVVRRVSDEKAAT
jgi:hypothetical protein